MEADRVTGPRQEAGEVRLAAHSALTAGGCVQDWTEARNRPSKLPFPPFRGTPGATTECQSSIGKSCCEKQIRPEMGVPGRSVILVGIGAPKLPHRFPPHV